ASSQPQIKDGCVEANSRLFRQPRAPWVHNRRTVPGAAARFATHQRAMLTQSSASGCGLRGHPYVFYLPH
ncbi:MAG: hypothetical protein ACREYE_01605, partial [Gammaproteobacteria bacterium]